MIRRGRHAALGWAVASSLLLALPAGLSGQAAGRASLADLPLVEEPAPESHGRTIAVVLSGDGNWADLVETVSRELRAHGLGVVGFKSRDYLLRTKTPDELGADLTRLLDHYLDAWRADSVVLVGYSRGADLLPFMVSRLPPRLRERLLLVALLGPEPTVGLRFHPADIVVYTVRPGDLEVRPEIERLFGLPLLCVYGAEERHTACTPPPGDPTLMPVVRLRGGHHFDGDFVGLARRILAAAGR